VFGRASRQEGFVLVWVKGGHLFDNNQTASCPLCWVGILAEQSACSHTIQRSVNIVTSLLSRPQHELVALCAFGGEHVLFILFKFLANFVNDFLTHVLI
jgi:hypothetical protein